MSSRASSVPPLRRTPLIARLAYGQLALAALAFMAVPALALKKAYAPEAVVAANSTDETGPDVIDTGASSADNALASADPMVRGEAVFGQSCAACHQPTGAGIPGAFPPLAASDYLLADPERAVGVVLHGLVGPVTVNGVDYASAMPPMPLDDADVAAVVTYVLQAWGNQGPAVTAETVARLRAAGPKG